MPSLLGFPALEFKSLQGSELLGNLFNYTLQLQTPDNPMLTELVTANVPIKDLVGQDFSVRIALDGKGFLGDLAAGFSEFAGPSDSIQKNLVQGAAAGVDASSAGGMGKGQREINGLVTRARFVHSENRRSVYEIVIEPWLVLATRTSDYKIFQNKTPLEIIQEVLDDYIYPSELRITHSYPARTFQVQYGETDFDFISRLMEEFGIYYFWEHKDGAHKLILVDDVGAHKPFESEAYQSISFYGESAKIDEEYCSRFDVADTLTSGQWVTDDFDFTKPRAKLQVQSKMPRETGHNQQEIYRWPGDYADPEEGQNLVKVRMEAAGAPGKRASGSGNLRAMVPGCTFGLQRHPQQTSNREWLILGATLALQESSHAAGGEAYHCHVEFEVQPANDIYRSLQRRSKPHTLGPQTAIVTGPAGQEIWTNEYGQVKLSFHWNRYCSKDENSSCWIRVSSPSAGNGFGGISVPRIGQEVIVDFENGDPDRPIVTGRVWNAMNMPPWSLPGSMTQSGMLTRSSPGGGTANANALRFEDKKGAEEIWLHAEKDMRSEVENNESHSVGADRSKTITQNETVKVGGDRIKTIGKNETITITENRTETVGGTQVETIKNDRTVIVTKGSQVNVVKGDISMASETGSILISAPAEIRLMVGSSYISLTEELLEMISAQININK